MGRGRFVRLFYATFGRPGNQPYRSGPNAGSGPNAQLMCPFTARPSDLEAYCYHETRVAALGPFFSGVLVLSLALAAWWIFQAKGQGLALALVMLTILGSLLFSVHLWWPRFGPQLWLLPIVPLAFIFSGPCSRWVVGAAWILLALLAVDACIVAGVRMAWETRASQKLRRQLSELHESGREIEIDFKKFEISGAERLKAWGVLYRKIGRKERLSGGTELMSVVDGYPGAVKFRVPLPSAASRAPGMNGAVP
jgi:hypothetical protein